MTRAEVERIGAEAVDTYIDIMHGPTQGLSAGMACSVEQARQDAVRITADSVEREERFHSDRHRLPPEEMRAMYQ